MTVEEEDRMHQTAQQRANNVSTADDDLAFAGLTRLSELLHGGQVTPRELAEFYLARIERLDPTIGAFISIRAERALAEADAALERLRAGERGALLGVPIAVKDNVDLAGEVTTHGSAGHREPARADTEVVRRLRAAGAVILGKTALCELAAWGHFTSSAAFGTTRNPWKLDRSPGGSSGGSAAAVAAGLVPIALGSDGGGSIRIPAACCGLFGLKPQRGRVPLAPASDHWYGCTVFGGLGRSVLDVATFDDAIRGPLDGAPSDGSPEPEISFAAAARRDPGRLRIAVSLKPAIPGVKPSTESIEAVQRRADLLRSLGHEVREYKPPRDDARRTGTPTWNYVGQPAASIPAGFDGDGLPTAIQLAGPPNSEPTIISVATQIESVRPWHEYRPSLVNNHGDEARVAPTHEGAVQ
jgi:amidase